MYAAYSAAKSYVLSFSYAMNRELAGIGVSITSTCPGFTATEFHEVAHHEKTGFMKLNGVLLEIMPRWLSTAIVGGPMKK